MSEPHDDGASPLSGSDSAATDASDDSVDVRVGSILIPQKRCPSSQRPFLVHGAMATDFLTSRDGPKKPLASYPNMGVPSASDVSVLTASIVSPRRRKRKSTEPRRINGGFKRKTSYSSPCGNVWIPEESDSSDSIISVGGVESSINSSPELIPDASSTTTTPEDLSSQRVPHSPRLHQASDRRNHVLYSPKSQKHKETKCQGDKTKSERRTPEVHLPRKRQKVESHAAPSPAVPVTQPLNATPFSTLYSSHPHLAGMVNATLPCNWNAAAAALAYCEQLYRIPGDPSSWLMPRPILQPGTGLPLLPVFPQIRPASDVTASPQIPCDLISPKSKLDQSASPGSTTSACSIGSPCDAKKPQHTAIKVERPPESSSESGACNPEKIVDSSVSTNDTLHAESKISEPEKACPLRVKDESPSFSQRLKSNVLNSDSTSSEKLVRFREPTVSEAQSRPPSQKTESSKSKSTSAPQQLPLPATVSTPPKKSSDLSNGKKVRLSEGHKSRALVTPELSPESSKFHNKNKQRNYKNMTRERRIEANARERVRVHTISAAFDALRRAIPSYSCRQKLSKLAILRVASSYIMALSNLLDDEPSGDTEQFSECVDTCTKTIQSDGRTRKRKDS